MFIGTQRIESVELERLYQTRNQAYDYESLNVEQQEVCKQMLKCQQYARIQPDELLGNDCVQAFISNMSACTSLEEIYNEEFRTLPEVIISSTESNWTVPKWAKAGDIIFFMHSKTARSKLTALRSELESGNHNYTEQETLQMQQYINHALDIHAKYGGKIFAIGRICGAPEFVSTENIENIPQHWKSVDYADIDNIVVLTHPVDISEFRDFIYVSRGSAITPLFDSEFIKLRNIVGKRNSIPLYLKDAEARPIPLRKITYDNWISVANAYRRCFILEKQFRKFYVDYMIREIGDRKTFYTECRCRRSDINDSFMDYVMRFYGKYLPVEIKLSVKAEPHLLQQVSKYVYNSEVFLKSDGSQAIDGKEFHPGKVLIIDTENVLLFDAELSTITEIFKLDLLRSKADLRELKHVIALNLGMSSN